MRSFLLTHEYADVYADMGQVLRIKFGKVHKGTKPIRYKLEKVHRTETKYNINKMQGALQFYERTLPCAASLAVAVCL